MQDYRLSDEQARALRTAAIARHQVLEEKGATISPDEASEKHALWWASLALMDRSPA